MVMQRFRAALTFAAMCSALSERKTEDMGRHFMLHAEDHFVGDEDEKTIGEPVHDDGTPLAAGENATNATNVTNATAAAEAGIQNATESVAEANGTEEGTVSAGSEDQHTGKPVSPGNPLCWVKGFDFDMCCDEKFGDGGNTTCWGGLYNYKDCCFPKDQHTGKPGSPGNPLCWGDGFDFDKCCDAKFGDGGNTKCWVSPYNYKDCCFPKESGSTSAEPVEANETEEASAEANETKVVDELLAGSKSPADQAEESDSTSAEPAETKATEESSTSAGPDQGGSTSSAPVEANETEDSPYDHADDAHELDPNCQDAFLKLPAAIRQHFVGLAKGKGDCMKRAMVPETALGSEEGGSTSSEPAEAKATEESTTSTSAGPKEGGSTSAAPVEANATKETPDEVLNQSKPREASLRVDARGRPVEVQHHDATESTVSAGSEEGSEEEEEEEDNATKEIAISTGFVGGSSTSAAPRNAGAAGKSTDPLDGDDFSSEEEEEGNPMPTQTDLGKRHVPGLGGLEARDVAAHRPGEGKTASGFAPPLAESVADEQDACTEVKYSWKSVRPSATVCLPEDAPMTALLAAVCSEQLGPAGYDISKCSAEPYVRCQGKSEQGKWYSVDQKQAAQATVGAELQNDFEHSHFTCENRVKI
jgi:hypothetical protein